MRLFAGFSPEEALNDGALVENIDFSMPSVAMLAISLEPLD